MSEEYKANVDLGDVTWPDAGTITARGVFVDGQHFWLNQQEEGPTLDEIDDMCKRRDFSYYYDDWGPSDQGSRTVLQSMMNEAIARWGHQSAPPADETMSWIGQAVARAIDEQMPEAAEPIPLSERKPYAEDCHYIPNSTAKDGAYIWAGSIIHAVGLDGFWSWDLVSRDYMITHSASGRGATLYTHWLPSSTKYLPARVEG
jgi:hypothetical protein